MKLIFRNSDSLYEIVKIIQSSTPGNTIIWQNRGGKRALYYPSSIFYDEALHTIRFQIKNFDYSLLVDETIYVKLSYNDTLFKGKVVSIDQSVISVYLPEEIKTLELRQNKRIAFMPKDEKKIYLELAPEITSERVYQLAFTALDVSTGGVSIIVSDNNKQLVESSGKQLLTALGGFELEKPVLLDLRYSQTFRYRIRGKTFLSNRYGFKFLEDIDQSVLDQFIAST